ncbi:MAG: hypothetical protein FWF59_02205 [Turicibacter sp.]|nr:hypothetical protein [Turicibacter sp.]
MNSLFMTPSPIMMIHLAENAHIQVVDYGFSVTFIKALFLVVGTLAGMLGPKYC